MEGCKEFFKSNGYDQLEFSKVFDQGDKVFNSLIVGSKAQADFKETIITYLRPKIERYDIGFFGTIESILFDILDNYEDMNLMLVTDSLSYPLLITREEVNVAIQNLMDEGMYLLFLNDKYGYALFDDFEKLRMPIPLSNG